MVAYTFWLKSSSLWRFWWSRESMQGFCTLRGMMSASPTLGHGGTDTDTSCPCRSPITLGDDVLCDSDSMLLFSATVKHPVTISRQTQMKVHNEILDSIT